MRTTDASTDGVEVSVKQQVEGQAGYTCLLAGATGLIGSALLRQLVQDTAVSQITVLSRRALDVTSLKQESGFSKLRVIVGSFDEMEIVLADVHADVVFCTLGTTIKKAKTREAFRKVDYEYPLALAQWAERHGSDQYAIVTAMGASTSSMFFYSRVKGELEESLAKLRLPIIHVFQPSLLLGERPERRAGEMAGAWLFQRLHFMMIGPLRKYRAVQGEAVANAMKQVVGQAAGQHKLAARQGSKQATTIQFYSSQQIAELAVHTTR